MSTIRHIVPYVACLLTLAGTGLPARDIVINSEPQGARVSIRQPSRTSLDSSPVTPATIDFRSQRDPYILDVSLPGYQSETIEINYSDRLTQYSVSLQPLQQNRTFSVTSEPADATVKVDGRNVGTTPTDFNQNFTRNSKFSAWSTHRIVVEKDGFTSFSGTLSQTTPSELPEIELVRLENTRTYTIIARTRSGAAIPAEVSIGGEVIGTTPHTIELDYERDSPDEPWPKYTIAVGLTDKFVTVEKTITYNTKEEQVFILEPVTEYMVPRLFPTIAAGSLGYELTIDRSEVVGKIDEGEPNPPGDLSWVTRYTRDASTGRAIQVINSFTIEPDGKNLVFSISSVNEDGSVYANLYRKSATEKSMIISQLTRGTRFLDCHPFMSRQPDSSLLVFQSNRYIPATWDVSAVRLREGRVVGGIRQLTRDGNNNFGPTFISAEREVYFLSAETHPGAVPAIHFVQSDGSAYTNLGESALSVFPSTQGRLYFVARDTVTGRKEINSITAEGQDFSNIFTNTADGEADSFDPNVSPDGKRLLFVSNFHKDENGRNQNDIFLLDLDGGTGFARRLTENGSDDIMPQWSPTEPGVLYFLSNRGGAYNIWRMTLIEG